MRRSRGLAHGAVSARDGGVSVDRGAMRGSRRSHPAADSGRLGPIRTAVAEANGVKPARFSATADGACPNRLPASSALILLANSEAGWRGAI
jgi:hypothetical protein